MIRQLAIRSAKRAPRAVFDNCSSDDLAVLPPTHPRWSLRPRHGHDLPSHSSMSCQHRHRLVTVLHHLDIPCRDPSNKRTSLCNFLVMSSACFATRGRVTLFLRYMIEFIVLLRLLCTLDVTFALAKPLVYCDNIVYKLSAQLFATSLHVGVLLDLQ